MIKSGAVIQNRYLNNPYPTNYNPMGRPGNFDVARPFDSSSIFDTGLPKDVSPYQPRVAVSVEIQPKSVFKPSRLQKQLKEKNPAKWGQTALSTVFSHRENELTNYMAQRLLGLVSGQPRIFSDPNAPSTVRSDVTEPASSEKSMGQPPLQITIPESPAEFLTPKTSSTDLFTPTSSSSEYLTPADAQMETVGEIETQPIEAARAVGMLDTITNPFQIVQDTMAGLATVEPRKRKFSDMFF